MFDMDEVNFGAMLQTTEYNKREPKKAQLPGREK